ncbi:hypothetical protein GF312_12905 [Candidatus Poribacteria bacterium]|nr:hypothetical protein [Candidatus Poribacteria bacterium]
MRETDNRWMPPSPHKEAVLEFLRRGRAHIEERGHNLAPLLIFEDGGVMELPQARYKDGNFSPAEGTSTRQTSFYDVCGTVDELKKLMEENPEIASSNPERLFELIDDACYMLSRMQRRREKYQEFAQNAKAVAEKLNQVKGPKTEDAFENADNLKIFLREHPDQLSDKLNDAFDMAEGIRDVANRMEKEVLYAYRDLAIELGTLYSQIKGSRKWEKGE